MSQTISERLEHLRKANSARQWINGGLYRLLYRADLYMLGLRTHQIQTRET